LRLHQSIVLQPIFSTSAPTPLEILGRSPLFHPLSEQQRTEALDDSKTRWLRDRTRLWSEGEMGRSVVLVLDGTLSVAFGNTVLGRLGPGALIGLNGLNKSLFRQFTVGVLGAALLIELPWSRLKTILQQQPSVETGLQVFVRSHRAWKSLTLHPLFALLDEGQRSQAATASRWLDLSKGEVVIRQGEVDRDLYIVVEGSLEVFEQEGERELMVNRLGPGAVVGEFALIDGAPRAATVRTLEPTQLLHVPAEALEEGLGDGVFQEALTRLKRQKTE